jgi:dCMP deaminase
MKAYECYDCIGVCGDSDCVITCSLNDMHGGECMCSKHTNDFLNSLPKLQSALTEPSELSRPAILTEPSSSNLQYSIDGNKKFVRTKLKLTTFMNICCQLSDLSHDSKYQVATIIISEDFREICSIGFNGDFKGGSNVRSCFEHGQSGFLHSEENALIHLNKPLELRNHLILMCTHKPCSMCSKRIVNSGIKRVIYKNEYKDSMNQTDVVFETAKVVCKSFEELILSKEMLFSFLNALF